MKLDNRAQNSLKTWKSSKLELFKVYVCHVQTKVYIYNQTWMSPQKYMHEGKWLKECICIANSLDKIDIYIKLNINLKLRMVDTSQNVWIIKTRLY